MSSTLQQSKKSEQNLYQNMFPGFWLAPPHLRTGIYVLFKSASFTTHNSLHNLANLTGPNHFFTGFSLASFFSSTSNLWRASCWVARMPKPCAKMLVVCMPAQGLSCGNTTNQREHRLIDQPSTMQDRTTLDLGLDLDTWCSCIIEMHFAHQIIFHHKIKMHMWL